MVANDIPVTIKLPFRAHQRLHAMAAVKGYTATVYAGLLFNAAFSARLGQERDVPVDDAELDAQVTLVFACAGQGDVTAIAKATGVKPQLVERILKAWRRQRPA